MLAPGLGNMARFRTRSEGTNRCADLKMALQVIEAIERALNASKSERDGLGRRVSDALSRAAMLVGNGTVSTSSVKLPTPADCGNMKPKSRTAQGDWTTSIMLSANSNGWPIDATTGLSE
jgi:hypothetical protein